MKNNEDPSGLTLTLFSTFDSCEDAAWARGPKEGSGFGIGLCDEALDGDFELGDRSEHAALEAPVGEFGEEALDGIEPGGGSRREVEGPARVFCEPFLDFWMLVGGVIVDDRVDRLSLGDLRVDLIEEADELLMPMTFHVAADDGAIENVERGEQCGRAVALVVVGLRTGSSGLHRQSSEGGSRKLNFALHRILK